MNIMNHLKTERRNVLDILKALGIISVVVGHCHPDQNVVDFVYSYHLALFLFASGLQYNIGKYSTEPFLFLQNRVRSMWIPFFGYLSFFTLTHNLALSLHLLADGGNYGNMEMVACLLNNFAFLGGERLGGALWFVPVMLITIMLFAAIVYIAYSLFYRIRVIVIVCISGFIGVLGAWCNLYGIELTLHMHTGLLLLPVMTAGYLLSSYHVDFNRFFRWPAAIPCLCFVLWAVIGNGRRIELSMELIGDSEVLFYLITFCGIYFVSCLAKGIERIPWLSRGFAFVGRYSFDIMALHFFLFKIIDGVYGRWIGDAPEAYSVFPCAYPALWPFYVTAGVVLSPWIRIGINRLFSWIRCGLQSVFSE